MEFDEPLITIEKRLWNNGATFYRNNLIEETLLVFGETGVIRGGVAIGAISAENAEGRR